MSTPEQEELYTAAALVVTSVSRNNLKNHNGSYDVLIARHKIERLHAALEAFYPGWIERIYDEKDKLAAAAKVEREAELAAKAGAGS